MDLSGSENRYRVIKMIIIMMMIVITPQMRLSRGDGVGGVVQ